MEFTGYEISESFSRDFHVKITLVGLLELSVYFWDGKNFSKFETKDKKQTELGQLLLLHKHFKLLNVKSHRNAHIVKTRTKRKTTKKYSYIFCDKYHTRKK